MHKIKTLLTAAALATSLAACGSETGSDAETSAVAEAMPETRDISETAADEQVVREGVPPTDPSDEMTATPEPAPAD